MPSSARNFILYDFTNGHVNWFALPVSHRGCVVQHEPVLWHWQIIKPKSQHKQGRGYRSISADAVGRPLGEVNSTVTLVMHRAAWNVFRKCPCCSLPSFGKQTSHISKTAAACCKRWPFKFRQNRKSNLEPQLMIMLLPPIMPLNYFFCLTLSFWAPPEPGHDPMRLKRVWEVIKQ